MLHYVSQAVAPVGHLLINQRAMERHDSRCSKPNHAIICKQMTPVAATNQLAVSGKVQAFMNNIIKDFNRHNIYGE